MTGKKIAVLVLVGLVLALSVGIISAPEGSVSSHVTVPAAKNIRVDPSEGYYYETFNFSVDVRFYETATILLMAKDPVKGEWKRYGECRYNNSSHDWQTLWWNGTSFNDPAWAGKDISYKFCWEGEDLNFSQFHIKEKLTWVFKNATVRNNSGYYCDKYNYSVEFWANKKEAIGLEIYNVSSYEREKRGDKQGYTKTGEWDLLSWPEVTIASADGEGLASYRFYFIDNESRKRYDSEIFYGPTLKPVIHEEIFENASVEPHSGYYNTHFNYSVEASTSGDVELWVYDIGIDEWASKGKGTVVDNRWEWESIRFAKDCSGIASYKFVTGSHESEIFYGPTLKPVIHEEIFKNATVSPSKGNFSTAFDYTVEVNNSSIEINNVTLEVYDGSGRHICSRTNKPSDGNRWEWKDITFGVGYEGIAKYKFLCNNDNEYESAIYYGPLLLNETTKEVHYYGGGGGGGSSYKPYMQYENANVEPNDWTIKGAIESKTFYYSVEVDKKDMLILEIYNPSSNEWEEKGKGNESNLKGAWGKWRHEWNVTLTLDKNWAGYGKYRFYPERWEKYASQVYYGPEIKMLSLSDWKQEIGFSERVLAEPEIEADVRPGEAMWFKEFTYTANITHPDRANMTVALFVYKPGSNDWKPVPWRGYTYNPIVKSTNYKDLNTATISWTVEESEIFDYKDGGEEPGKESMFYIWYWDGCNEYEEITGGYFHGPRLLANHEPEFIEALPVSPGNGSTHAVYEYSFEVNDPDNETVHGYLTVIDPLGNERKFKDDPGKKGYIQFTIDPDQRVFTEEKLREYTKITGKKTFTSSYKLEFWDDGMIANGTEAKIEPPEEGWFMGPHVSLVKVIPVVTELNPKQGKYNAEYEFIVGIKSTKKNKLLLTLNISDPSNPEHSHQTFTTRNISVATDTIGYATWRVTPTVFGPDDFGKTARYKIAWEDQYGNKGIINGTGPYIERAVPISSIDPPLRPIVSMVAVPAAAFVFVLLVVLLNAWGKFRGILKLIGVKGLKGLKGGESGEKKEEEEEGKKRGGNGE